MINWDALFLKLLHSRASGGQDDYAVSILLYPISQILIVSRNIQPRVEIRENPTKGIRRIGKK